MSRTPKKLYGGLIYGIMTRIQNYVSLITIRIDAEENIDLIIQHEFLQNNHFKFIGISSIKYEIDNCGFTQKTIRGKSTQR